MNLNEAFRVLADGGMIKYKSGGFDFVAKIINGSLKTTNYDNLKNVILSDYKEESVGFVSVRHDFSGWMYLEKFELNDMIPFSEIKLGEKFRVCPEQTQVFVRINDIQVGGQLRNCACVKSGNTYRHFNNTALRVK